MALYWERKRFYVRLFQRSGNHTDCGQTVRTCGAQMQGPSGGGRNPRRPGHRSLCAQLGSAQRQHFHLCRGWRGSADVFHRPWHQSPAAAQGRSHCNADRLRGRGRSAGERHPALRRVLWLCRRGQHGVLPCPVYRYHHDSHQRLHHGGNPSGAGSAQGIPGHDHHQCGGH